MDTTQLPTLKQMADVVSGTLPLGLKCQNSTEAYTYIEQVLVHVKYHGLDKQAKGSARSYLGCITGLSQSSLTRLIAKHKATGHVTKAERTQPTFSVRYTREDVAELARLDELYERMSGQAMATVFKREYGLFGNTACARLKDISVAHIYNLRHTTVYQRINTVYTKTKPSVVKLGERIKPEPDGRPGFLRVDSEHQGDKDGEKGVYHINLVDEVTQWEIVICVKAISERYMLPALILAMDLFPFIIINFHADNGSEYINKVVVKLLNKLLIKLTKSRPRHSGDNGLVETKNGVVLRKHMGYIHIPRTNDNVEAINRFYVNWFIPWLNFHRPCAFRETAIDERTGKVTHGYPTENYMIPYEKLKDLDHAKQYLKAGVTFDLLDAQAYALSDAQWTQEMQLQKQAMWESITL